MSSVRRPPVTNAEKALPLLEVKREAYHAARNAFHAEMHKAFPIGSRFRFRGVLGGKMKIGEVIDHGEDGRIQILNPDTKAIYWRNPDHLMREVDGAMIGDENDA